AFDLTGDTVAVSLRIFGGINEESILNSLEVSAVFNDLFHEQAGSFLDLSGHLSKPAVLLQFNQIHQDVKSDKSMLGCIAGFDVVDVPRNVSSFIRSDCGLDVSSCQFGDEHVQYMSYSSLSG